VLLDSRTLAVESIVGSTLEVATTGRESPLSDLAHDGRRRAESANWKHGVEKSGQRLVVV
jgi:hypothetical protein